MKAHSPEEIPPDCRVFRQSKGCIANIVKNLKKFSAANGIVIADEKFFLTRAYIRCMKGAVLFLFLLLAAVCIAAPASAFVDRNGVTSAAQFKEYLPASYLTKAGITDSMTVDQALDAYITYALSFSSPTAYAYIAQLSSPSQVTINAGGSTTSASRGDVVSEGWAIEAGNGASFAIRFPGGVTHTITGPYTYTVPAYGAWGSSAAFGGSATAAVTSVPAKKDTTTTTTVATMSSTVAVLPDTSGYAIVKKEINCRGTNSQQVKIAKVKGDVYAVHYSQNPANPGYFLKKLSTTSSWIPVSDETTIVVGAGSSVAIEEGLDIVSLPEKTLYVFEPRYQECIWYEDTGWKEKTFLDTVYVELHKIWRSFIPEDEFQIQSPTAALGVRG